MRFYDGLKFQKIKKISENVVAEQGLALQQHFPYKSFKFSQNTNCRINSLFNARGLKLGNFWYFRCASSISNRNNILVQQTHFTVDIDDVHAGKEGPFYTLARIDVKRRNVFQLSSVLYFKDGTESKEFLSKPFRVTTAKKPHPIAEIRTLPIPDHELGNTYTEVHTLVSDLVFASKVKFTTMQRMADFSAAAKVLL